MCDSQARSSLSFDDIFESSNAAEVNPKSNGRQTKFGNDGLPTVKVQMGSSIDLGILLHWIILCLISYHTNHQDINVFLWVPVGTQIENVLLIFFFEIIVPKIWFDNRINKSSPLPCLFIRQFGIMILNNALICICFQFFPFCTKAQFRSQSFFFYSVRIGGELVLTYLLFEILQTLLHKLVHTRLLFRYIHYWHHETMADRSYTGFSMHPVDIFAQVIIPSFVPTLICCPVQNLFCFFSSLECGPHIQVTQDMLFLIYVPEFIIMNTIKNITKDLVPSWKQWLTFGLRRVNTSEQGGQQRYLVQ